MADYLLLDSILLFIRFLGLGISFDFYLKSKESRFIYSCTGWFFWVLSSGIQLFIEPKDQSAIFEVLNLSSIILITIGSLLIATGIVMYFLHIHFKIILTVCGFSIITPSIAFWLVSIELSSLILLLLSSFVAFSLLGSGIYQRKDLYSQIGSSVIFFYISAVITVIYALISLLFIFPADIDYFFSIAITLLFLLLLIHLENSLSIILKDQLKDRFSHELGNILQTIVVAEAIKRDELSPGDLERIDEMLRTKWQDAAILIKEIRGL